MYDGFLGKPERTEFCVYANNPKIDCPHCLSARVTKRVDHRTTCADHVGNNFRMHICTGVLKRRVKY